MKLAGKPYAGKPHVRFDEGATEQIVYFAPYSTLPLKKDVLIIFCMKAKLLIQLSSQRGLLERVLYSCHSWTIIFYITSFVTYQKLILKPNLTCLGGPQFAGFIILKAQFSLNNGVCIIPFGVFKYPLSSGRPVHA